MSGLGVADCVATELVGGAAHYEAVELFEEADEGCLVLGRAEGGAGGVVVGDEAVEGLGGDEG